MFKLEFCKSLSANDLGLTQSHQAGLLIPKRIARLPYFPILDRFSENPRESMTFYSIDLKTSIQLSYIYYNNKDRGSGTRSEYRLTGTTKLFRELKTVPAQNLEFGYIDNTVRAIIIKNEDEVEINSPNQAKRPYITTNGWKIVEQK